MGQNCVAGTTEYDEENGIGLVMYVESGNNMIVWKMSDGTKQGTTVPVSSDYQNMLRTAFENKTGTTIGYFIFHPYTEETIDIESSITINSGDTPTKTLKDGFYKIPYDSSQTTYYVVEKQNSIAFLYAETNSNYEKLAIYDFTGVLDSYDAGYEYISNLLNNYDNVSEINLRVGPSRLENWEDINLLLE